MRAAAFVSGGLVPKNLRGSHSKLNMHIVHHNLMFIRIPL